MAGETAARLCAARCGHYNHRYTAVRARQPRSLTRFAHRKCRRFISVKIYTKTGDAGDTGLFGGPRVSKDAPRIEAYGTVDELNSALGVARAHDLPWDIDELLA